jgi:hypothetical protein
MQARQVSHPQMKSPKARRREGAENAFFEPFCSRQDQFIKTGSGHKSETLRKMAVSAGSRLR